MGTRVLGGTRRRRCNPRTPGGSGRSGCTGRKGGRLGCTEPMGPTHAVRTRALSVWSKRFLCWCRWTWGLLSSWVVKCWACHGVLECFGYTATVRGEGFVAIDFFLAQYVRIKFEIWDHSDWTHLALVTGPPGLRNTRSPAQFPPIPQWTAQGGAGSLSVLAPA